MSLTPSTMLPLGTIAPNFQLPTGDGQYYSLNQLYKANGILVIFMSNHCPFVIHLADTLAQLSQHISEYDVGMVGINANDANAYPADSPEKMVQESLLRNYKFPYLYDASQQVAKAYNAACTPDFFLFDGQQKLVYRGQFDDSRPNNGITCTGESIYQALEALKQDKSQNVVQKPSIGCNIKWKTNNIK